MGDFTVCQQGACARQPKPQQDQIAQRLEDLMRRMREDGHEATYADLVQVAGSDA